jgi:hypothetical protein
VVSEHTDPMLEDWLSPQARAASAAVLESPRPGRGKRGG